MTLSRSKINSVFKTLDLDTDAKREKYLNWYTQNDEPELIYKQSDTQQKNKQQKPTGGENAKLEQSLR